MKLSTVLLTLAMLLCYHMFTEAVPIQDSSIISTRQSGPIQTPAVGSLNNANDDDDDGTKNNIFYFEIISKNY